MEERRWRSPNGDTRRGKASPSSEGKSVALSASTNDVVLKRASHRQVNTARWDRGDLTFVVEQCCLLSISLSSLAIVLSVDTSY